MTDQPPPEQPNAPAPQQQTGPPTPAEHGEAMRFLVRMQDNEKLPNYNQPAGLFRFQVTPDRIVTDRLDRDRAMWVDWPNMLAFTGVGGADDFVEIKEDDANRLIEQWLGQPSEADESPAEAPDQAPAMQARGFELSGSLRRLMKQESEEQTDE